MPKTKEEYEAALKRTEDYLFKLNDKIAKLEERLKNTISKQELEKLVA